VRAARKRFQGIAALPHRARMHTVGCTSRAPDRAVLSTGAVRPGAGKTYTKMELRSRLAASCQRSGATLLHAAALSSVCCGGQSAQRGIEVWKPAGRSRLRNSTAAAWSVVLVACSLAAWQWQQGRRCLGVLLRAADRVCLASCTVACVRVLSPTIWHTRRVAAQPAVQAGCGATGGQADAQRKPLVSCAHAHCGAATAASDFLPQRGAGAACCWRLERCWRWCLHRAQLQRIAARRRGRPSNRGRPPAG